MMNNVKIHTIVFALSAMLCNHMPVYSSTLETHSITLKGNASGGVLKLVELLNRNARYVLISTTVGEPAESVANRLASVLNESNPFGWWGNIGRASEGNRVIVNGDSLERLPGSLGMYVLAGTEKGLDIPSPPLSLSCSYDADKDQIVLHWINSPEGYDDIFVIMGNPPLPYKVPTEALTKYVIDNKGGDIGGRNFCVVGFSGGVPSNAAAIYLSGNAQEELFGIPFTNNVAPNWTAWSTAKKIDKVYFEQGDKYPNLRLYNPVKGLLSKPYYQVINPPPKGVVHGVYRRFLGLNPGHTYRLIACLSTLEMDSIKGDWSFSLHAVPNGPDGKDLTGQQMAGLAPLPGGRSGPQAGRIAVHGPGNTTKGAFDLVFSGDKNAGDPQSSHITLPAGVDTITVWVRFRCSDPKGKVGFSGVRLEDITAIENPKSPAEVRDEETAEEIRLLKWMEKAAREASDAEIRP
jgi:hypothetical protein